MIIGTVLADRYRIEKLLSVGGMGSVWLATDVQAQRPVVVKLVTRAIASFPIAVTRFLREMRVLALSQNPHVVELLDRGVDADLGPYFVMERLEGQDLQARVERGGPVPLTQMASIAQQIGCALTNIHKLGFVHRDVKPANVFLCPQADGTVQAKLLDFGAALADVPLRADGSRTTPGMLIGTLTRMSPEQIQGELVDERTDVWSLAVTVYEAVVGTPAIHADWSMSEIVMRICMGGIVRPSEENPSLPASFDAWFKQSTQLDPENRYRTVREQVEALVSLCEELPADQPRTERCDTDAKASAPLLIEVTGSVSVFPLLTVRGPSKVVKEVLRHGSPRTLRPLSSAAKNRSTWPAPVEPARERGPWGIAAGAAVGCPTVRPPSRWPSAR